MGVPEPVVGMQWSVRLHRTPAEVTGPIDDIPVLEIDLTALGAHPAKVRILEETDIGEHQRIRLIRTEIIDDGIEVVRAAGAPCAVQPKLSELAIVRRKLL